MSQVQMGTSSAFHSSQRATTYTKGPIGIAFAMSTRIPIGGTMLPVPQNCIFTEPVRSAHTAMSDVLPEAHRLPDRRADRSAVRTRRRAPHRRHFRLHRPPAPRAAGKAQGLGLHQRQDRRDPRLEPDLAIGFSDIQADIAQALIKPASRSGSAIIAPSPASWVTCAGLARWSAHGRRPSAMPRSSKRMSIACATCSRALPRRPRVYFEEWDEPQISCIRWVERADRHRRRRRRVSGARAASLAQGSHPRGSARRWSSARREIIIGSWCGKKFRPERVAARPGWDAIPAVRDGELHEIKSPIILQPGPAALTDGLDALHAIVSRWADASTRRPHR